MEKRLEADYPARIAARTRGLALQRGLDFRPKPTERGWPSLYCDRQTRLIPPGSQCQHENNQNDNKYGNLGRLNGLVIHRPVIRLGVRALKGIPCRLIRILLGFEDLVVGEHFSLPIRYGRCDIFPAGCDIVYPSARSESSRLGANS